MQLQFRKMTFNDIDDVMFIELEAYPFPWTHGIFKDCIKSKYECWVVEERGQLVGYMVFTVGAGESHLLNVCVEGSYRRQGIAKILLKRLYQAAFDLGAEAVFLEVRPSNVSAVDLYRAEGFEQISVRKGYYPGQPHREDALIFRRPL